MSVSREIAKVTVLRGNARPNTMEIWGEMGEFGFLLGSVERSLSGPCPGIILTTFLGGLIWVGLFLRDKLEVPANLSKEPGRRLRWGHFQGKHLNFGRMDPPFVPQEPQNHRSFGLEGP